MYVTVHTGSSEVVGRLRLLEKDVLEPGETSWAQVKLDAPLAVVKGDYYVIRSNSRTLGGGNIVETHARRHRRKDLSTIERLEVMELGSPQDILLKTIETSEPSMLDDLVKRANMGADIGERLNLRQWSAENLIVALGGEGINRSSFVFSTAGWDAVMEKTQRSLEAYYRQFPLRRGAPKEELRSRLGMSAQVFNLAFARLQHQAVVEEDGALVRLPGYEPTLSDAQNKQVDAYLRLLETEPFSPPTDAPLDSEVLNLLDEQGKVVRVSESVVYSAEAYEQMVTIISEHIRENGDISVANVRDVLATSRKYALALMDYLDHKRITRRVGDTRVLR